MIKTKVAFLEGRLLSSQSEQAEKFSKQAIHIHLPLNFSNCQLLYIYISLFIYAILPFLFTEPYFSCTLYGVKGIED